MFNHLLQDFSRHRVLERQGVVFFLVSQFAHPVEEEFARFLDQVGLEWHYEQTTFSLSDNGKKQAFKPDFYLPELDVFVELTTMRRPLMTRKNRKARLAQERYGISVVGLGKQDILFLARRYNLQSLADAANYAGVPS